MPDPNAPVVPHPLSPELRDLLKNVPAYKPEPPAGYYMPLVKVPHTITVPN